MNNYNDEIEKELTFRLVMEEASRCLLCKDAPCSKACPALTDPARFIRAIRFKNVKGAAEVVRENNALAAICARVCPTEKYCQSGCSRSGIDKPIEIAKIQRYITDFESRTKMNILSFEKDNGKKIAIVGSGPSGLTAALELRKKGYDVTIFEKYAKAGGYLRYGIPEYRLPSGIVDEEIKRITSSGVKILTRQEITNERLQELKKEYDGVIVACGQAKGKMLPMFENNKRVITAVEFLKKVKEKKGDLKVPENVLVVGGGDVAMDTVVTLKKLGVRNVTDVVYEEFSEFRASKKELELAQKENVSIIDGYVPFEVKRQGIVIFKHRFIESEIKIKTDLIILATGQVVDANFSDLKFEKNEFVSTNYHVNKSNLFVCGDIAHGDKTVVYSVKTGKEVAEQINKYLGGK